MNLPLPEDPLFHLLHQIARRADELAVQAGVLPPGSVEPWLQAEREIWGPDLPAPSFPLPDGVRAA